MATIGIGRCKHEYTMEDMLWRGSNWWAWHFKNRPMAEDYYDDHFTEDYYEDF